MRPTFSTAKSIMAGAIMGAGRINLEVAVWNTARLAADLLVTTGFSILDGSYTLIPFVSSVARIIEALMNPAVAVAKYAVIELNTKSMPPAIVRVQLDTMYLVKSATLMLVVQASR